MQVVAEPAQIRLTQRRLFLALGVLILAVIAIGYGPRVFVPGLFQPTLLQHILVRIHVVFVALWLCSFSAQLLFAALGRMKLHRTFGLWAFRIAAIWVITALVALWVLLRQVPQAAPVGFLLLTQILLFSLCVTLAFRERLNPPEHMRWVILAMSQAIIGGIERLPIAATHDSYDRSALVALLFPLALFLYDATIARRIYRASVVGGIAILVVHLLRIPISHSTAWLAIAHRLAAIGS